jgi:hypothetical protein
MGRRRRPRWIPDGEGTRYLKVQVGSRLPPKANFEKMMLSLKGKFIRWSNNKLSLAGKILVANQVLLASMWYIAASWNPSPRMCSQVRGVVRNFIWGGRDAPARAKVKWNTMVIPITQGGLGIIDPKAQSEALLAKLLTRGLAPGGEPWKELIRHKADQTRLPVHSKGPSTADINWIFAAMKLKKTHCSMWDSILRAWLNVRPRLIKTDPTNSAEILRQPLFGNPLILNSNGSSFEINGLREGNAFAQSGCSRVKDLQNVANKEWKSLTEMKMSHHPSNRGSLVRIAASIPWRPYELNNRIQAGDWISKPDPNLCASPDWIYYVLEPHRGTAKVIEFKKITPSGLIQATTHTAITLSTKGYRPVRILSQDKHDSTLKVARDTPTPSNSPLIYWIFETGFIQELLWDPREWHWQATPSLGDAPFFGYTTKKGYRNTQKSTHTPSMHTFIQGLNLCNSTTP